MTMWVNGMYRKDGVAMSEPKRSCKTCKFRVESQPPDAVGGCEKVRFCARFPQWTNVTWNMPEHWCWEWVRKAAAKRA